MKKLKERIERKLNRLTENELEQLLIFIEALEWKEQGEKMPPRVSIDEGLDALIGLFDGPPDLADKSEALLFQALREHSGWTWKEGSQ